MSKKYILDGKESGTVDPERARAMARSARLEGHTVEETEDAIIVTRKKPTKENAVVKKQEPEVESPTVEINSDIDTEVKVDETEGTDVKVNEPDENPKEDAPVQKETDK